MVALDIWDVDDPAWEELLDLTARDSTRMKLRRLDVARAEEWRSFAEEEKKSEIPICGLINNAGVTLRKTVGQTTPDEWRRVLAVNLDGAFFGIHYLAPIMSPGSSIVNISSVAGLTGSFSAAY